MLGRWPRSQLHSHNRTAAKPSPQNPHRIIYHRIIALSPTAGPMRARGTVRRGAPRKPRRALTGAPPEPLDRRALTGAPGETGAPGDTVCAGAKHLLCRTTTAGPVAQDTSQGVPGQRQRGGGARPLSGSGRGAAVARAPASNQAYILCALLRVAFRSARNTAHEKHPTSCYHSDPGLLAPTLEPGTHTPSAYFPRP